jgi:hypothetical protein
MPITDPHGTAILPTAAGRQTSTGTFGEDSVTSTLGHEASIFSGSKEAEERAQAFTGPGQEALDEREVSAERKREESRRAEQLYGKDAAPDGDGDGGGDGEGD